MNSLTLNRDKQNYIVHPQEFALWLALASMTLMFAGFTSAYIVNKAGGNWENFRLPDIFYVGTGLIVLSSLTMECARRAVNANKRKRFKWTLFLTMLLGGAFLASQYFGWQKLWNVGVYLSGNPSGSFLYVISGAHFVHVIGGLIVLALALIDALINYSSKIDTLIYETDPSKKRKIKLISIYWHFVGILWVYLFIFFQLNHL